jgi:hypothetical protein
MGKFLADAKTNLLMSLRLAFFRVCETDNFIINADQLVLLLFLDLLLKIGFGFLLALPKPVFDVYSLPTYALDLCVFFLLIFIVTKLWKKAELFLTICVIAFSLTPITRSLDYLDHYLLSNLNNSASHYPWWDFVIAHYQWLASVIALYSLAILWRVFYVASGRLKGFAIVALLSVIIAGALQLRYFSSSQEFWYLAEDEGIEEKDRWAEYRAMDAEALMYQQPKILASALQTLKPQHEHKSDLFFVGFAGYATEDVFSKEVTFAKNLLDTRFDTKDHSINLINHLSTRKTLPLANATNLAATLKQIGSLMNKEDDVLLMYLTSHGSKNHKLSVSFWPLQLNDITPKKLRTMLDDAGIKWRVIIISACYSGGFLKALENNETLVATSAASDKTSFGCGTESEFTYFGEALFKNQLSHEYSFVSALQQVRTDIDRREKREKIEASFPQLSIGKSIQTKLESLSKEIQLRHQNSKVNSSMIAREP